MDLFKACTCPTEDASIDFSIDDDGAEDLEEIDDDELIEDEFVSHSIIWKQICDQFDEERRQIEEYKLYKSTKCEVPLNPAVQFLEKHVFPLLVLQILETTINKAKELKCINHQKSAFNGVDFIAEMLWNLNPKHPERENNWTYIFDMNWVNKFLERHPRPFYEFSWIWSRDYAALLIQAAMRGYWVRCRADVQEMRQFWKAVAKEKEAETRLSESV